MPGAVLKLCTQRLNFPTKDAKTRNNDSTISGMVCLSVMDRARLLRLEMILE